MNLRILSRRFALFLILCGVSMSLSAAGQPFSAENTLPDDLSPKNASSGNPSPKRHSAETQSKTLSYCILVPGWQTQDRDYSEELQEILHSLERHMPDREFQGGILPWESRFTSEITTYGIAAGNTERASRTLSNLILTLPSDAQKNIILIGHSLGCRVIAKSMEKLKEKNVRVLQIVFFAAAIPDEDPAVDTAASVSQMPLLNFVHPQDGALMAAVTAESLAEKEIDLMDLDRWKELNNSFKEMHYTPMLGLGSAEERENFQNVLIAENEWDFQFRDSFSTLRDLIRTYIPNHDFQNFRQGWQFYLQEGSSPAEDVLIPQDAPNLKMKVTDGKFFWAALETHAGWELQENRITHHCRILDPEDCRAAWGKKERLTKCFAQVKKQLEEPDKKEETDDAEPINGAIHSESESE